MLRPLTRSSGKFGRNTRHSKRSIDSLKNKNPVASKHQGTPQIRRSISQKSSLTTSRPKIALSVSSSTEKRLSNKLSYSIAVPRTSIYRVRSQSESILGTPTLQLGKKSTLIKHFHAESPLIKESVTEIEPSISTDFKRMTRSSTGYIDTNLMKNRSRESRLAISPLPKSTEKHIQCKKTVKEKELNLSNTESKRMTRSSIDKAATNIFFKKSSKHKDITLHQHAEKQHKQVLKEKETNVITENPKRVTRCSIGGGIVSSSVKNSSKKRLVTSSIQGCAEKQVKSKISNEKESRTISKDSKHMEPSSFQGVTESTPLIKKTPKCKILDPPTPLSAQSRVRSKKTEKEASIIQKDSVKSRKAAQKKSGESTSVTLMRNTRKSNSGSLPAKELRKRKPVVNEDCVPLDCLTMDIPNKRPRRHTVDVCIRNKKAQNPSTTIQQKTSSKTRTRSSKPRKSKTHNQAHTSSQSNSEFSSAPDMSQLSIDCLTTFRSAEKSRKKRPKSAPAGIKRKSKVAGLLTPIPKKGTLKRQRWMFNALKAKNEGYEDDLFENQKLHTPAFRIINEADDESDSSIPTPKFGFHLTPALPKKTPTYKEIISSTELLLARKNAEEYLYRRNKKRTSGHLTMNSPSNSQTSVASAELPEKKKLEFTQAMEKVESICKNIEGKTEDESEDDYFTDAFT